MKNKLKSLVTLGAALLALVFFMQAHPAMANATISQTWNSSGTPPTASFTIGNTTPNAGQHMSWSVGANECDASNQSVNFYSLQYCDSSSAGGPINPNASFTGNSIVFKNVPAGNYQRTITFTGTSVETGQNAGSQQVTINYSVTATPCSITSITYTGSPSPINYNTAATITVATQNCTSASISGGQYGSGASATLNGSFTTSALTTSTTYTYTATGPSNTSSVSLTVPVGNACTINVNSNWNGVQASPPGGYNYTISGPSTFSGSGAAGYSETPNNQAWTITYTGGSTVPFTGYNNNTQVCNSSGGSITFTLNFASPPPGNPGSVTADNSSSNASVQCNQVLVSWTAGSTATSYHVYRSDNPNTPIGTTTGLNYTDNNVPSGSSYTYSVQAVNSYGSSSKTNSNSITAIPCVADFNLSDMLFKSDNGLSLTFTSSCVTSQSGPTHTIKNGDVIKTSVCLVNNGTIDATSVALVIDGTNSNLTNPRNFVYNSGGSVPFSTSGNLININLGTITAGQKVAFTFDSDVTAPSGNSQQLQRMRYTGYFTYTTSKTGTGATGCYGTQATNASPCTLDTGYKVFYNGVKAPTEKEVNP